MQYPDQRLLQDAQHYVKNLFATRASKSLTYHNYDHTWDVVQACEEMGSHYNINEGEHLVLITAAWFHDTGYVVVGPKDHEEESQRICKAFLKERNASPEFIAEVNECIAATKMPAAPQNLLQQILCDADLFHLGTDNFSLRNKQLREEISHFQKEPIGKREWRQANIDFLERHRYFTDYARERQEPAKHEHLNTLKEKQSKKEKAETEASIPIPMQVVDPVMSPTLAEDEKEHAEKEKEKDKDKEKDDKDKQQKSDRSIVAMFRIMSENHVNLSSMADSKANIMISINTIVISILVSVLLGKLQFYPQYIIPTIILMLVCLGAIVFSILATRPNISGGTFSQDDIREKKINLLFFGNFYNMSLPDYDWAMREMMQDKEYLYGNMIKDIYFLGVVLARKYKLLRIAYNIFMFGLIAAIVAFGIAMLLTREQ
jgi:predicted metal-dependent HD superfamily phosphohydrolase